MPEVKWTNEQQDAISKKGSNILVAAAAGSGKTAVLVERIIQKILEDKIDIDKILVVTFTNAAASEMRERILDAIYKKMEENPEDTNLQKQLILLNKASICTIDSFCLDVIRNNFFEIDVSANARIADSTEILLLKQEVLDDLFEEKYVAEDKDFLELIETYTKYNKDDELKELILNIYNYIQSSPFPEEWLDEKIEMFDINSLQNFSDTRWGSIITEHLSSILDNAILKLSNIYLKMQRFEELDKFTVVIENDIENYKFIQNSLNDWDRCVKFIQEFKNKTWPRDKKVTNNLKDEAKNIRDSVKDEFKKAKVLIDSTSKEIVEDMNFMYKILIKLKQLIIEFSNNFYAKKRERNIMDFNDMEHLALKILVKKDDKGNISKTEVAKSYEQKFEEIAIDEYQDSNLVQEYILTSVSRENNIFMVGDVKQSIYKFRQARPQLFLDKYNKYKLDPEDGQDRKIQLFKNFRSRKNILDFTNLVFKNIMSKEIGNIDYTEEEYLNLGANFENIDNQNLLTEINVIDLEEEENDIWKEENYDENSGDEYSDAENNLQEVERIEDVVLEAKFVAKKIKELISSKYKIYDRKTGIRDIKYKDICVLLRSITNVAGIYEKEISELGLPVYSDSSGEYLQSIEIETIMSLLRIINNPLQDIPLVTVMRSPIGNFTDNELVEIRMNDRNSCFYNALLKTDTKKVHKFLNLIEELKNDEQYMALDEWIWNIYTKTGYMNYVSLMPNGNLRVSNLRMLFERAKQYESASFKGLFNFINFIDKIKFNSEDLTSAKIIGENEDVIRIMSIHKSKGLEFPVVILAGTGKQFNMQDLNGNLLLDQDLGIGPQYIDYKRHIKFKTLPKRAISIKAKKEAISEEMRVLYVALTRAKEKLIIVGRQKDVNKKMQEKQNILEIYSQTINPFLVQKYKTYLDWLELIYLKEGNENTKNIFTLDIYKKSEIINNLNQEKNEEQDIYNLIKEKTQEVNKDSEEEKSIKKLLDWKYKYNNLEGIPTKTSVTKIKEITNIEEVKEKTRQLNINIEENQKISASITEKPKFLNEDKEIKISNAQKGTLMHLCIQKMDEKKDYNLDKINELISELQEKNLITQIEANSINKQKLLEYTKSKLWDMLKNAKEIHKEKPFYINIKASRLYDNISNENDENILVQGVIDLYFITNQDKLVLIDFKTDYIQNEEEFVNKYKRQLELYKEALEQSLNRKVDQIGLYSLYLNKTLEVKM